MSVKAGKREQVTVSTIYISSIFQVRQNNVPILRHHEPKPLLINGFSFIQQALSGLALKIVVMARQEARVKKVWAILLFFTQIGFIVLTYLFPNPKLLIMTSGVRNVGYQPLTAILEITQS
ncbi:MAG: hypothetical protein ACK5QF_04295 [Dolichospermum sp.]